MSLELKTGQTSIGTLVLTDKTTGLPVAATFANVVASSSDSTIALVTVNPDGTITAVGVASGTATASITADASFSDSNGNPSTQSLATSETIVVDSVVPPPNEVTLSVSWSTPA